MEHIRKSNNGLIFTNKLKGIEVESTKNVKLFNNLKSNLWEEFARAYSGVFPGNTYYDLQFSWDRKDCIKHYLKKAIADAKKDLKKLETMAVLCSRNNIFVKGEDDGK